MRRETRFLEGGEEDRLGYFQAGERFIVGEEMGHAVVDLLVRVLYERSVRW